MAKRAISTKQPQAKDMKKSKNKVCLMRKY